MIGSQGFQRKGAYVALFALLLQLFLSFGHIHADGLVAGHGGPVSVAGVPSENPATPDDPASDGLAHHACAICASMALAGTLVLPTPAAVPMPTVCSTNNDESFSTPVLLARPFVLFLTTGPPSLI